MPVWLSGDEDGDRARLASIGGAVVATSAAGSSEVDVLVATTLRDGERDVRAEVDLTPPDDDATADQGMGAWHANAVAEAHSVLSGQGVMEFVVPAAGPDGGDAVVSVVVEAGDLVVVRGGEHRYRPLTAQRWAIRHSGGPEDGLGARETGRPAGPWPSFP